MTKSSTPPPQPPPSFVGAEAFHSFLCAHRRTTSVRALALFAAALGALPVAVAAGPDEYREPAFAIGDLTLSNVDEIWGEDSYVDADNVSVVGANRITVSGTTEEDEMLGYAPTSWVSFGRLEGAADSSLTVDLRTSGVFSELPQSAAVKMVLTAPDESFEGTLRVRVGRHALLFLTKNTGRYDADTADWDPIEGDEFLRPTLMIDGEAEITDRLFLEVGSVPAGSQSNLHLGSDGRLIVTDGADGRTGHGAHLTGNGSAAFEPGSLILVTNETFTETAEDWHALFDETLTLTGLENVVVFSADRQHSGRFVVSGDDVLFTQATTRHTGPLGRFAEGLVAAMDDPWCPPAMKTFLENEMAAMAARGADLGPAVSFLATAHLRTGLEEDLTRTAASLGPELLRIGRTARPTGPLWVSKEEAEAYRAAYEMADEKERAKLRDPSEPRGLSWWVDVSTDTLESERSAYGRGTDRRETDRTSFRFAGVSAKKENVYGFLFRYEDRDTTVGDFIRVTAESTTTGATLWWQRPLGKGEALWYLDWTEASENLQYSPSGDVYVRSGDVSPSLWTLGQLYTLPMPDKRWRLFGAAAVHYARDYDFTLEASSDDLLRIETDDRLFGSLGTGFAVEGRFGAASSWEWFLEGSVWGLVGERRYGGTIEAPWASSTVRDDWRIGKMPGFWSDLSAGVGGAWRNYRFRLAAEGSLGSNDYERLGVVATAGRVF